MAEGFNYRTYSRSTRKIRGAVLRARNLNSQKENDKYRMFDANVNVKMKPSYWSDEDSPIALRKTPDPFDLLLKDSKSQPIFSNSSDQLSPDPINNLSNSSSSPFTPVIKEKKTLIKLSKKSSSSLIPIVERKKPKCLKKYPKYKSKNKIKPKDIFTPPQKDDNNDNDNLPPLVIEVVEKKKPATIDPEEIIAVLKESSIYDFLVKKKLSNIDSEEVFNDNVPYKDTFVNDISSIHQNSLLENSLILCNDADKCDTGIYLLKSSTPRKTEHDLHKTECDIHANEHEISAIKFIHSTQIKQNEDIASDRNEFNESSKFTNELEKSSINFQNSSDMKQNESIISDKIEFNESSMFTNELEKSSIKFQNSSDVKQNESIISDKIESIGFSKSKISHSQNSIISKDINRSIHDIFDEVCENRTFYSDKSENSYRVSKNDTNENIQLKNDLNKTSNITITAGEDDYTETTVCNKELSVILEDSIKNECTIDSFIDDSLCYENISEITSSSNDNQLNKATKFIQRSMQYKKIMPKSIFNPYRTKHENNRIFYKNNFANNPILEEDETIIENNESIIHSSMIESDGINIKDCNITPKRNNSDGFPPQLLDCNTITARKKPLNRTTHDNNVFDDSINSSPTKLESEKISLHHSVHNNSVLNHSTLFSRINLLPGKKWRRSLNMARNISFANMTTDQSNVTINGENYTKGRSYNKYLETISKLQNESTLYESACLSNTVFNGTHRKSVVRIIKDPDINPELLYNSDDPEVLSQSRLSISHFDVSNSLIDWNYAGDNQDARRIVLDKCNQIKPLQFDECYPDCKLKNCQKIGEGAFGEVYLYKNAEDPRNPIVMKVIPIEGERLVNDFPQKKFNEIVSEVVIASELSDLRKNSYFNTISYNKVHRVRCVKGRYPERLQELWCIYDDLKGSENDYPEFDSDQLYIILELENGGKDLETFLFTNAKQAYALFFQIAYALATAEKSLKFEHRDLHWGNILVKLTEDETVNYTIDGIPHEVPTCGVFASIIDFTLSRISVPRDGCIIYNDLANDDDLFNGDSDHQFEVYRMMKTAVGNSWETFEPCTNILWLDYLLRKMTSRLCYSKKTTKVHKQYMSKLQKLADRILHYASCKDFIEFESCEIP